MDTVKQEKNHRPNQKCKDIINSWVQCIQQWFPNLQTRTYFLPPLYFNRVPYDQQIMAGHSVLVPQAAPAVASQSVETTPQSMDVVPEPTATRQVFDSDVRHDNAQVRVLTSLRVLADRRKEVMVVVSQLQFGKYLHKPVYAAASSQLPQIRDLPREYQRGDFDILIIHPQHGLIIGEVNSVGGNLDQLVQSDREKEDIVAKRVLKMAYQLNKAGEVLKHLVSDMEGLNVIKTLMLPNLTNNQLFWVASNNVTVEKELCGCLGVHTPTQAVDLCVCSHQLPPQNAPWDVSDRVASELDHWWQRCIATKSPTSKLSQYDYEFLVARFCGPATTVEVPSNQTHRLEIRTEGEGVAEAGNRMAQFCLFPDQVEVLNKQQPRVFVTGPPGTGKSIMLYLQGMQWLHEGKDVHVVSIQDNSRAASILMEHLLTQNLRPAVPDTGDDALRAVYADVPKVYRHAFNFDSHKGDVDSAVDRLVQVARDGRIYILADELERLTSKKDKILSPPLHIKLGLIKQFAKALNKDDGIKMHYLFSHMERFPENLGSMSDEQGERFHQDIKEMETRFEMFCKNLFSKVPGAHLWAASIFNSNIPRCLATEIVTTALRSPPVVVREIQQSLDIGLGGHKYTTIGLSAPTDGAVIKYLFHENQPGHDAESTSNTECKQCGRDIAGVLSELHVGMKDQGSGMSGLHLEYRDVLVVCESPHDYQTNSAGQILSPCSGLVFGLRSCHVPVCVVERKATEVALRGMALMSRDMVTVAHWKTVQGLERKVVVVTGEWGGGFDRLLLASRCTSQLVWVDAPKL